jgi:putative flippase GtrA
MLPQLTRFGFVGMLGSAVNLAVFAVMVKYLSLNPNIGATASFLVAVSHNFTLNRLWTFHIHGHERAKYAIGWTKYAAINLVGFCINLMVLNTVITWIGGDYTLQGQALGILCGMVFNFILAKLLVFPTPGNNRG